MGDLRIELQAPVIRYAWKQLCFKSVFMTQFRKIRSFCSCYHFKRGAYVCRLVSEISGVCV